MSNKNFRRFTYFTCLVLLCMLFFAYRNLSKSLGPKSASLDHDSVTVSIPLPPPSASPMPSPSPRRTAASDLSIVSAEREFQKQLAQRKKTQELYEKALENLPLGQSFHNVPNKMKANVPVLIKAGIAPEVTKQLLNQLDVQGDVTITNDVRYDHLGVDIKLNVDDKMFKVRPITEGRKPVIPGDPAIWIWELTPLKRGKTVVTIMAIVELKVPGVDESYERDAVVFSEEREVEINPSYSISQFVGSNWAAISTVVFGSGSAAAFIKWLVERQAKQGESPAQKPVAGFARLLSGDKQHKGK